MKKALWCLMEASEAVKENTRRTIEYPGIGITIKPPWGAFIVLGNKRHENRGLSEAGVARKWIGNNIRPYRRIAITASKHYDEEHTQFDRQRLAFAAIAIKPRVEAVRAVEMLMARLPGALKGGAHDPLSAWDRETAGKIIGVAELVGVERNGDDPPGYWQAAGQHGLVLGRVWEVQPVPCTGGQGVWRLSRCPLCGRPIANTYGTKCNRCAPGLTYPAQLTVKAEYGADGEELWRAS